MKNKKILISIVLVSFVVLAIFGFSTPSSETSDGDLYVEKMYASDSSLLIARAKSKEFRNMRLEAMRKMEQVASETKSVLENRLAKVIAKNKELDKQIAVRTQEIAIRKRAEVKIKRSKQKESLLKDKYFYSQCIKYDIKGNCIKLSARHWNTPEKK